MWCYIPSKFHQLKTFLWVVENISDLRNKVENNEAELRRKDRIISELVAKLDVAKVGNHNQAQMEDISIPAIIISISNTIKLICTFILNIFLTSSTFRKHYI